MHHSLPIVLRLLGAAVSNRVIPVANKAQTFVTHLSLWGGTLCLSRAFRHGSRSLLRSGRCILMLQDELDGASLAELLLHSFRFGAFVGHADVQVSDCKSSLYIIYALGLSDAFQPVIGKQDAERGYTSPLLCQAYAFTGLMGPAVGSGPARTAVPAGGQHFGKQMNEGWGRVLQQLQPTGTWQMGLQIMLLSILASWNA